MSGEGSFDLGRMPSSPFDPPNLEDERGQRRLVANVKKAMDKLKTVYGTAAGSIEVSNREHANDLRAILEAEIAELKDKSPAESRTDSVNAIIDDAEKMLVDCPKLVLTENTMNGAGDGTNVEIDDVVELNEEQRKEAIDTAVKGLKAAMNLVEVAISAETRGSDVQIQQKRTFMINRKREVEKLVSTTPEDATILALFNRAIELINADLRPTVVPDAEASNSGSLTDDAVQSTSSSDEEPVLSEEARKLQEVQRKLFAAEQKVLDLEDEIETEKRRHDRECADLQNQHLSDMADQVTQIKESFDNCERMYEKRIDPLTASLSDARNLSVPSVSQMISQPESRVSTSVNTATTTTVTGSRSTASGGSVSQSLLRPQYMSGSVDNPPMSSIAFTGAFASASSPTMSPAVLPNPVAAAASAPLLAPVSSSAPSNAPSANGSVHTQDAALSLLQIQVESHAYSMLVQKRPKHPFTGDNKRIDFDAFLQNCKNLMNVHGATPGMKLSELPHWFSGTAGLIVDRFTGESDTSRALEDAFKALKKEYGRQRLTAKQMLNELLLGEKIPERNHLQVKSLVINLEKAYKVAEDTGRSESFNLPETVNDVIRTKVPHLAAKWAKQLAYEDRDSDEFQKVSFTLFLNFVKRQNNISQQMGEILKVPDHSRQNPIASSKPPLRIAGNQVANGASTGNTRDSCPVCPGTAHGIVECRRFANMSRDDRAKTVREKRLCVCCLGHTSATHKAINCATRKGCDTCGERHHSLLHGIPYRDLRGNAGNQRPAPAVRLAAAHSDGTIYRLIVPMRVTFGGRSVETYGLLDSGATGCGISRKITNLLQLPVRIESRRLSTFNYSGTAMRKLTSCTVEALDGSCILDIGEALVGEILTTEREKPPSIDDIAAHPFMEGTVSFAELDDSHVGIVLSAKYAYCWELGESLSDGPEKPICIKTAFGWALIGMNSNESASEISLNCCSVEHPDTSILENVDRMLKHDFIAREGERFSPEQEHPSRQDMHAVKQFQETIRFDKDKGHYVCGIPWGPLVKNHADAAQLINRMDTASNAKNRLRKTAVRMHLEPARKEGIWNQVQEFIDEGHAVQIDDPKVPEDIPAYYLPIHVVTRPDKPGKWLVSRRRIQGELPRAKR